MAAGKYKLRDGERVRVTRANIATDTVIEAGDFVAIASGLIIKAVAASTKLAWCPDGHAANSGTVCEVTLGNDFTLQGTTSANFAVANKGIEYDIVDTTQVVNLAASSTKVVTVGMGEDAGVVGSAAKVTVKINLPIF